MKKDGKIRTSLWVSPQLLLLLNERGLTLSWFIGRTLPAFLDLPVDPRDEKIQVDLDKAVLRARSTYESEMRELMKNQINAERENMQMKAPVKKIFVFDNTDEQYREIPEDQYDPKWHVIRQKVSTS